MMSEDQIRANKDKIRTREINLMTYDDDQRIILANSDSVNVITDQNLKMNCCLKILHLR